MTGSAQASSETAPQPLTSASSIANPYVGPRPFERQEEHLFFGRDREARDLISLIIANRVFVLYSQSGAGKSSLLNTKVVTGLEKEHCRVLPIARVQGEIPASITNAEIGNIFAFNAILSLRDEVPDSDPASFAKATIAQFIERANAGADADEEPVVLIFDQFEELFSFYEYRWADRAAFLHQIIEALGRFPELNVVFSLREDFIAKLDAYDGEFPNRLRARYHLERLQRAAALEAISSPADASGRQYDKGVAEALVDDLLETRSRDIKGAPVTVPGEFVEPVQLQVVCSKLWENIPAQEKVITGVHLKQSGNVDDALRKFYDDCLATIAAKAGVPGLEIRRWFERALFTSAGTRGTVFRDIEATAGMPNQVVDLLEDRHLIRGDWRAGAQWYEITHDRLLRPIRESNRLAIEKANRSYWLKIGSAAAVVAVMIFAALGFSLNRNIAASQREDSLLRAAALINASSRLPPNDLDQALLLAVEAYRAENSASPNGRSLPSRSNLLSQVLRARRIEWLAKIYPRDFEISTPIPDSTLMASVATDLNLVVWDRTDQKVLSQARVDGDLPHSLFADKSSIYVISRRGESQVFNVDEVRKGVLKALPLTGGLVDKLKSGLAPPDINPNDIDLLQQRDRDVRRTVAFAAGRLLVAKAREVVISDHGSGAEIARFPLAEAASERGLKVLDVGLTADGKFAFAQACETDDQKGKTVAPQQARPSALGSVLGVCARRFAKFWQLSEKPGEIFVPSGFTSADTTWIAIGSSGNALWTAFGKDDGTVAVTRHDLQKDSQATVPSPDISVNVAVPVADLLFTQDATRLISISGGQAISWNLLQPPGLERIVRAGMPFDIATNANGAIGSIGSKGYSVLAAGDYRELFSGDLASPSGWRPDGRFASAVSVSSDKLLFTQYGVIELVDFFSKQKLFPAMEIAPAISVALDPTGQYFAAGQLPPWIEVRDKATTMAVDASRVPVIWKLGDQKPVLFVDLRPPVPSKDGNPAPGQPNKAADEPVKSRGVMGVAFSPDGRTFVLATAGERSGGGVEIYKKNEEGSFVRSVEIPTDRGANVVAFSRNGKLLAASQPNGQVMLIDAEAQVPRLIAILTAPGGEAGRLAFNSDASLLAVIGSESSAVLWDVATRTQFGRPIKLGRYRGPTGVVFSREDQLLAADANLDSMVSFDLSVDSWIVEACKVARRELTDAERTFYKLPTDAPKTCAPRPAAASAR